MKDVAVFPVGLPRRQYGGNYLPMDCQILDQHLEAIFEKGLDKTLELYNARNGDLDARRKLIKKTIKRLENADKDFAAGKLKEVEE